MKPECFPKTFVLAIAFLLLSINFTVLAQTPIAPEEPEKPPTSEVLLTQEQLVEVPPDLQHKVGSGKLIMHISEKIYFLDQGSEEPRHQVLQGVIYFDGYPSSEQMDALADLGVELQMKHWTPAVGDHPYGFFLANIPPRRFLEILALEFVKRVDTGEYVNYPHNNQADSYTGASTVWNSGSGWTGYGVKVGVIDSDLDVAYLGTEFPSSIDAYDCYGEDYDVENTTSNGGHGTHVTGTVLGRGYYSASNTGNGGGAYKGMAYEADLCFLKIGQDILTSASSTDMIQAMGLAVSTYNCDVLNMSYGGWYAHHDGSSTTEQQVDWVYDQGVPFFISAGNEADNDRHYSGTVSGSTTTGYIQVDVTGAGLNNTALQFNLVWYDPSNNKDLTFTIYNSSGNPVATSSNSRTRSSRGTESKYFWYTSYVPIGSSTWYITINNNTANSTFFHIYEDYNNGCVAFNSPDEDYTIGQPASADDAFAVASYVHRAYWRDYLGNGLYSFPGLTNTNGLAAYSNRGPRVDNNDQKPNIAAPGSAMISVRDMDSKSPTAAYTIDDDGSAPAGDEHYWVNTGTSMASPAAAGCAALILQKHLDASPQDVYDAIEDNASTDAYTGSCPNDDWGYGKIDVNAAIDDAGLNDFLSIGSITSASALKKNSSPQAVGPFDAGSTINVAYTLNANMKAGNAFTVQLSDQYGSFSSPLPIGASSSTTSGTISCTLPAGYPYGTGYRIRIYSSSPYEMSDDNGQNITIYPTITTTATDYGSPLTPGQYIMVNYTVSSSFGAGNTFTAQLSDENGSFSSPTNIGTLVTQTTGAILSQIPDPITAGTGYRIRVVSSNPAQTGSDNGTDITIQNPCPTDWTIDGTWSTTEIFRAVNSIEMPPDASTCTLTASADFDLIAGSSIVLKPGLQVANGASLQAVITGDPCNDPAPMIPDFPTIVAQEAPESQTESGLLIYPNPNSGSFNLSVIGNEKLCCVRIYNALGEAIYDNDSIFGFETEIDMRFAEAGLYFIHARSDKNNFYGRVIIKR